MKILRSIGIAIAVLAIALLALGWWLLSGRYQGQSVRIFIPRNSTTEAVSDTLCNNLGPDFGAKVFRLWRLYGGLPSVTAGSYVINDGSTPLSISRKLYRGSQDPVRVTFNNVRTMEQLADKVTQKLEMSPSEFLSACDSMLMPMGFDKPNYPAAFVPDTYEFYWNADAKKVVKSMADVRNRFWNDERRQKAASIGLKPVEVATIASIVEEETAKSDERPTVARLYLNRLNQGMMLQADPTVKYAVGDFSLRRILNQHLQTDSPYNTYKHTGLPPGPIRIVERQTLDDVLNAPQHNYLYMCAREDFSGYHNFATTHQQHMANAARYHNALNRRNIK